MDKKLVRYSYVYITINNINGRTYTGQKTLHKKTPQTDGYLGSGKILLNAVRKYGPKNFTKIIKAEGYYTQKELDEIERYYIHLGKLDGKNEYNIAKGGYGSDTFSWQTDERKREITEKRKKALKLKMENEGWRPGYQNIGKKQTKERVEHRAAATRENWKNKSDEEKQKIIANRMAGWGEGHKQQLEYMKSDEYREKFLKIMSKYYETHDMWNKGRTGVYTEEQLKRMSEGRKKAAENKIWTLEDYKKCSDSSRGRKVTKETLKKLKRKRPNYRVTENVKHPHTGWTIICLETNEEMTVKEAELKYGTGHYRDVCLGKRKSAGGHTWKCGNPPANKNN